VKRIRAQNAAKQKLNERLAKAEASLFTQSSPPLYKEPSPLPPTLTKQKRSKLSRKEGPFLIVVHIRFLEPSMLREKLCPKGQKNFEGKGVATACNRGQRRGC